MKVKDHLWAEPDDDQLPFDPEPDEPRDHRFTAPPTTAESPF